LLKRIIILSCLLWLIIPTAAHAGDAMTTQEWTLEGLYQVGNLMDLGTTLDIQNHPSDYERNPLMGSYPSNSNIYLSMILGAVLHPLMTSMLPEHWLVYGYDLKPRYNWQRMSIGLKWGCVTNNFQLGLSMRF
jgi:hypothetical protein